MTDYIHLMSPRTCISAPLQLVSDVVTVHFDPMDFDISDPGHCDGLAAGYGSDCGVGIGQLSYDPNHHLIWFDLGYLTSRQVGFTHPWVIPWVPGQHPLSVTARPAFPSDGSLRYQETAQARFAYDYTDNTVWLDCLSSD